MADTKISALSDGSPAIATDQLIIARAGSNYKLPASSDLGRMELVYRYTVAGTDKARGPTRLTQDRTTGRTATCSRSHG